LFLRGREKLAVSRVIGIDFLPGIARAVAVSGTANKFVVHCIGEITLPLHEEAPEQVVPDEVSLALRDFVKERGLRGFKGSFSFPERRSILRILSVPKMEREELVSTITFEFDQVMDEGVANYCLDFAVLGEEVQEETERLRVLVGMVPKKSIFPYIDALNGARIPPIRADIPAISALEALHLSKPSLLEGNSVAVHLDPLGGDVILFHNGELVFIRRISLSLNELQYAFRSIVESRSPEEVENIGGYKQDAYSVPEEFMHLAKPLSDMVLSEVERTVSFYKSQVQTVDYVIDQIVLCGNGVWPRNLDAVVQRDFGKPVVLSNPLDWVSGALAFKPSAEEEMDLPRFSTAFGVAVNSLP